jgi:G1/S-specific cyclin PLC1
MYPLPYEDVLDFYLPRLPLSSSMIIHIAKKAAKAVPRISRNKENVYDSNLPSIEEFVVSVIARSNVSVPVLIASLVYLSRLQTYLPSAATGCPSTPHRVFLVALILADKAHNECGTKNTHWSQCSAVAEHNYFGFSNGEVNRMERQFLYLLDWDIRIDPQDLYDQLEPLLMLASPYPPLFLESDLGWARDCYVSVR